MGVRRKSARKRRSTFLQLQFNLAIRRDRTFERPTLSTALDPDNRAARQAQRSDQKTSIRCPSVHPPNARMRFEPTLSVSGKAKVYP
jgi:hypothetical protein